MEPLYAQLDQLLLHVVHKEKYILLVWSLTCNSECTQGFDAQAIEMTKK